MRGSAIFNIKNMVRYAAILAFIGLCLISGKNVYPIEGRSLYYKGLHAARIGNKDVAFMDFKAFLKGFPESKMAKNALFSTGEYYFSISDYRDAAESFVRFIKLYPEAKAKLFALVYLHEIAKSQGNQELVEKISKEIITFKQLRLLFSEFEEYVYWSVFSNQYKAVFFIDKVEIYINEELFKELSY